MLFGFLSRNVFIGSVYELELVFPFRTEPWRLLTFLWQESFSLHENFTLFRGVAVSCYFIIYLGLFGCTNAENVISGKSLENEFRKAAISDQRKRYK